MTQQVDWRALLSNAGKHMQELIKQYNDPNNLITQEFHIIFWSDI